MPTAEELIERSEMRRSERALPAVINYRPMYSLERIRRRALCEAVCEGIPDIDLVAMAAGMRRLAAEAATKEPGKIVPLAEMEVQAIQHAVAVAGSVNKAAQPLGMSKTTLYRKIRELREAGNVAAAVEEGLAAVEPRPRCRVTFRTEEEGAADGA
jgi:DNA-binding NtrC family response regulator